MAATAIRNVDPRAILLIGGLAPKYDGPDGGRRRRTTSSSYTPTGQHNSPTGSQSTPTVFLRCPRTRARRIVGGFEDLPALHGVTANMEKAEKRSGSPNSARRREPARTRCRSRPGKGPLAGPQQVQRWDWAGPLIYYELVDGGTDAADVEDNFGVLREDLSLNRPRKR